MATQISNSSTLTPKSIAMGQMGVDSGYKVSNLYSFRIQKSQNERFVVYVGAEGTIPNVYSYNNLEEMRDGLIALMTKEILECS